MESVITLIEKSRLGDQAAFARIVRQYQGMVSAATLNVVGNYAQSEDLAQETFLTAWKKLPELREPEKLASWLYGIARRVALRWLEQQQRDPLRNYAELNSAELDADTITDHQVQLEAEERHQREQSLALVWSTVKELPETLREPLLLYYRYSKSVADIAASLALTEEAVRQRLSRGRKMLKAEVEKHVESVLEATGPGEYFTVGVLATLPILATGNQVFAAGSAGAAAAQSASASGAGAGTSFVAGIATIFWTLLSTLYCALFYGLPVILGIWSGIRNAPTLRARQWMLKVTLGYIIAGSLFYLLLHLTTIGTNHFTINNPGEEFLWNFCYRAFYVLVFILPGFVLVSSYLINRRWRKIVEEDVANQDSPVQTASPNDFTRSMYRWVGIAACIFVLAFVIPSAVTGSLRGTWHLPLSLSHFEAVSLSYWAAYCFCLALTVLLVGFSLFYYAVQISKDQESFAKSPPRLPNLLLILTGEEKRPDGFRNRINFWGDLIVFVCGFFITLILMHAHYQRGAQTADFVLLPLLMLACILFVLFFAGIPRRRYWGLIFIGVSVLVTCSISIALVEISKPLSEHSTQEFLRNLRSIALPMWYLLCFTLLGVSGLYVFRRR